jgi:mRNA interferase MazF
MRNIDNYCFWDIILAEYSFSDWSWSKLRPVFVLFRDKEDYTVLKMTSQTSSWNDVIMLQPNPQNGLKWTTYLRMQKINTFHETLFIKKIWIVSEKERQEIKDYWLKFVKNL